MFIAVTEIQQALWQMLRKQVACALHHPVAEVALAAVEPVPDDNTRLVGDISSFGGE